MGKKKPLSIDVDTTVTVDVDISDFDQDDLATYLRDEGWSVYEEGESPEINLVDADTDEMVDILRRSGLIVLEREEDSELIEIRRAIERKDWVDALALFDRAFEANGRRK